MLQLHSSATYYWYNGITDMRKGFNALCGMVQQQMQSDILQGGVYIFVNRKRNQIKLLTWEGDGLAIYYKRLEKGVYELPVIAADNNSDTVDVLQLQLSCRASFLSLSEKKYAFHCRNKKSIVTHRYRRN